MLLSLRYTQSFFETKLYLNIRQYQIFNLYSLPTLLFDRVFISHFSFCSHWYDGENAKIYTVCLCLRITWSGSETVTHLVHQILCTGHTDKVQHRTEVREDRYCRHWAEPHAGNRQWLTWILPVTLNYCGSICPASIDDCDFFFKIKRLLDFWDHDGPFDIHDHRTALTAHLSQSRS